MTQAFKEGILLISTSYLQALSGTSEFNTQANFDISNMLLETRREGSMRGIQGKYFLFDWYW